MKQIVFKCRNKTVKFYSGNFLIMGILNITPDSFYDGGRFFKEKEAIKRAEKLISEETDIIDIGGESSKPNSNPISADEELRRVLPVLKFLYKLNIKKILISIDTYKSEVLKRVCEYNVHIANNIFALRSPTSMQNNIEYIKIVRKFKLGLILMHMQNTPKTMQDNPTYKNVTDEILSFLKKRIKFAQNCGIPSKNIIVDPGIGFGKKLEHNIQLLQNMDKFKTLNKPILVGVSRKSFIGNLLNLKNPKDRLFGSIGANIACFLKGAQIFRVHDVKETKHALKIFNDIYEF